MAKRRVVVTGMGALTPLGTDVTSTWRRLCAGESGIQPITHFDTTPFSTRFAGLVNGFDASQYIDARDTKKMDLFIQYGIAAGLQAVADANLTITPENAHRVGVMVSSGIGGLGLIEENHSKLLTGGPRRMSPFFVPSTIINMISGHLSMQLGATGPNLAIVTACTTGVHNIGQAARIIAYGDADVMLAGGAEKASTPLGLGGFGAARALSTRNEDPQAASRPWDKQRDGFVLGDGAGVMVLESYDHATARGAQIYAELSGFGMSGDAYHMTAPPEDGRGAAMAMENALRDADLTAKDVGYINAHGTSTAAGDIAETRAIKRVYGSHAADVLVSSTKSMTGHLLGAAGAIEAIFTVLALHHQVVPPTINLTEPDVECDLDYVPHQCRAVALQAALCNSFGFGGTNGSLLFNKL